MLLQKEIPRCGYCRSVNSRSSFSTPLNTLPDLKQPGRSPSGCNSANAGWDGLSRRYWIGFTSGSNAEISPLTAPDEGGKGRSGGRSALFVSGRYAWGYVWRYRIPTPNHGITPFIAVHGWSCCYGKRILLSPTSTDFLSEPLHAFRNPPIRTQQAASLQIASRSLRCPFEGKGDGGPMMFVIGMRGRL